MQPSAGQDGILRIGLIGLGQAATSMLPGFVTHRQVRIVGAAERRQAARDRFLRDFGATVFEDVSELCASDRVDAVYIATPHQHHREQQWTVRQGDTRGMSRDPAISVGAQGSFFAASGVCHLACRLVGKA